MVKFLMTVLPFNETLTPIFRENFEIVDILRTSKFAGISIPRHMRNFQNFRKLVTSSVRGGQTD